jgi:hypothetical protein
MQNPRITCRRRPARRIGLAALTILAAAVAGCGQPAAPPPPPAGPAPSTPTRLASLSDETEFRLKREVWETFSMMGTRVGYSHTKIGEVTADGKPLVRIDCTTHISLVRFGQPVEMEMAAREVQTPQGILVGYTCTNQQGAGAVTSEGAVDGKQLKIAMKTTGKVTESAIAWSAEYGGFYAVEQSLARLPMKPGERRTVHALDPSTNQFVKNELIAKDCEDVKILGETKRLLRIDTRTELAGQELPGAVWVDTAGEVWKRSLSLFNIETFRTSKEVALGDSKPASFDFGLDISVPVARRLDRPLETKRVRYRVTLDKEDPAKIFPNGATQQVRAAGPNVAEITVWGIRPGTPGNPDAKDDPPSENDRRPNNFVQSDHPKVAEAAKQGAGGETDPWKVATALERHANRLIPQTGYSQAFDTAADALASGRGDCTEHAVLLAALARAQNLPARAAAGLVYQDGKFLYHMWTEVYLDGRWIPLDATRPHGGTGAAYLKLVATNLQGPSPFADLLKVAQVAQRLKIEILEVE